MSARTTAPSRESVEKIDPTRAAAALTRWRRAVADGLGQDPGGTA